MKTVVIAAFERELRQFVHGWPRVTLTDNGRSFRGCLHTGIVAVTSGVGYEPAKIATHAAIAQYKPDMLVSAGLAGALVPGLRIASVVTPNVIFDAATAAQYRSSRGDGVLVTAREIADTRIKRMLAEKFHASCVDMEAAAVAEVAQQEGIGFRCVKAISDEVDFVMPPLNQFVDQYGNFQSGKFVAWTVVHPRYWRQTMVLARNSRKASKALCQWLKQHVGNSFDAATVAGSSRPVRLEDGESGSPASKAIK